MAKEKTGTDLAIKSYSLDKPAEIVEMAGVVKQYVVKQGLFSNIKGKNYAHVEGWQFAGFLTGTYPKIDAVENLSHDKEIKWKATANIYNKEGKIVGVGIALCSSNETSKKAFDEYAILSMAQTRAIGKAYRNSIGWVMKLAGYEATPSEEMHKVNEKQAEPVIEYDKENPRADMDEAIKKLRAGKSVESLNKIWRSFSAPVRSDDEVIAVAKEMKRKLA